MSISLRRFAKPVKATLKHPAELTRDERSAWEQILLDEPEFSSPFLAPEFAVAVGEVRPSTRVLVVESGGDLAFLPLQLRNRLMAQPICWPLSAAQALVTNEPAMLTTLQEAIRSVGIASLSFDHLVASQSSLLTDVRSADPTPMIDVSTGYAAYLGLLRSRSSSLVPNLERKKRKLGREIGELSVTVHEKSHEVLELILSWKHDQFVRTGARNLLGDSKNVRLLHRLLDSDSPHCSGALTVLYAGDIPVAAHMGLTSTRELSYWFPTFNPSYPAYSPGSILLLALAEAAADLGLQHIDLGKASEPYKERFKTHSSAVIHGHLYRPRLNPAIQTLRRVRRARGQLTTAVD